MGTTPAVLFATLAALADWWTSYRATRPGPLVEGNPLLRRLKPAVRHGLKPIVIAGLWAIGSTEYLWLFGAAWFACAAWNARKAGLLCLLLLAGCATVPPAPECPRPRPCAPAEIRARGGVLATLTADDGCSALLVCEDRSTGLLRCCGEGPPRTLPLGAPAVIGG